MKLWKRMEEKLKESAGFCKYKHKKCRFLHPENRCKDYMKNLKCDNKDCPDRHPKVCKWQKTRSGCRRGDECEYLHVTLVNDYGELQAHKTYSITGDFNCVGCKSIFSDEKCVVKHVIQNIGTYFCLNCDDWIREKSRVFEQGWTLLDQYGYLRRDI